MTTGSVAALFCMTMVASLAWAFNQNSTASLDDPTNLAESVNITHKEYIQAKDTKTQSKMSDTVNSVVALQPNGSDYYNRSGSTLDRPESLNHKKSLKKYTKTSPSRDLEINPSLYLDEIDTLIATNENLLSKVSTLESETLSLNSEILKLELALFSHENDASTERERDQVYNFVNVPIGSYVETAKRTPRYNESNTSPGYADQTVTTANDNVIPSSLPDSITTVEDSAIVLEKLSELELANLTEHDLEQWVASELN